MRGLRRHPSRTQIEAWFDGEAPEGLGWHLASCTSCFRHVDKLSRIRNAMREDFVGARTLSLVEPTGADPAPSEAGVTGSRAWDGVAFAERHGAPASSVATRSRRTRALVAVPVVVLLLLGTVLGISAGHLHDSLSASRGGTGTGSSSSTTAGGSSATHGAGTSGTTAGGASGGANGGPQSTTAGTAPGSRDQGSGGRLQAVAPLRLGVIEPADTADAADGTEIVQAVQDAVAEANSAGGVGGVAVKLTVVPSTDPAAVAALAGSVSAVVGGYGASAPTSLPWILPADPWASGPDVVAAELTPEAAGVRLGQDLVTRGYSGTVGVVEGTGPDAALATGLAKVMSTTVVSGSDTAPCLPEVTTLQARGVVAVAVAGSPTLAASCMSALGVTGWAPAGGVLLAPSAAYANVTASPDTFTVLGLPWPASNSPGAARFRAAAPGITSYRALVSFAAVELAVDVARSVGTPTMADIAGGTWHNDLFDFAGLNNAGAQVVEGGPSGWVPAP